MIGIDLVSVSRISHAIDRHGDRFLLRFLNENELPLAKNARSTAGLWAVKEAVSKALGCGIGETLSFYDILIDKEPSGRPAVSLSGKAAALFGVNSLSVSITHDGEYAVAVAIKAS